VHGGWAIPTTIARWPATVVLLTIAFGVLWYVRSTGSYKSAVYLFTTYVYVGGIVLMVGIELDEQLRKGPLRRIVRKLL